MAWTTEIVKKRENSGVIDFVVRFTDGVVTFDEEFRSIADDLQTLQKRVRNRIAQLVTLGSVKGVSVGPFDYGADATPSAEEVEFATWYRKYQRLKAASELVTLGVVASNHAGFVALKDEVVSTFKAAFIARM